MKKKVFISYSHQDKKFVQWLIGNLEDLDLELWYDEKELIAGDSIKAKINSAISNSSVFIIILSKHSTSSNWVNYELNSALMLNAVKKGIRIIPIKIDDCKVPIDLEGYLYTDFSQNISNSLTSLKANLSSEIELSFNINNWDDFTLKTFENLIFDLLNLEGFKVDRTPPTRDGGYDFIAHLPDSFGAEEKILIETKFYKSQKISIDILQNLYGIASVTNSSKVVLITNSALTRASKEFIKRIGPRIVVWEGHQLINKIRSHNELIKKYFKDYTVHESQEYELIDSELSKIQGLIKRLVECPEGKSGWKEYEDICIEIINHIFVPPLSEPKIQSRRENGIDIRDAIYPNRAQKNENWSFIRTDYDAKYIVFEFKNYSEKGSNIDKHVLLQIDDYLKKTIGRFGIVLSKKKPNLSGLEKRKDLYIENNKLVLFLNNEDLIEMLLRKHKNLDPSDVIIDMIDEFNLNF